jgi:hypothetical protein
MFSSIHYEAVDPNSLVMRETVKGRMVVFASHTSAATRAS